VSVGRIGKDQETGKRESGKRIRNRKSVRLGVLRERKGGGVGPLANKVWIPPESLVGSAPRPCGHEDLGRILREDGRIGKDQETEKRESGRRIQNRKSVRLGVLRERQGGGMGPHANKVWIPPESLVGRAPRPCGHEDLGRILRPQVMGESDAAQEGSVRKQEQSGRRSRACVHCHMSAGEEEC